MRRTERQLIDAALAVNEAGTLDEALAALASAARELVVADRVSILLWDADFAGATVVATSGAEGVSDDRIESNSPTARLGRDDTPFVVT